MARWVAPCCWLLLLWGGGCQPAPPPLAFNDFESQTSWAPAGWRTSAQAYSGRWSAKVVGPADSARAARLSMKLTRGKRLIRLSAQVWVEGRQVARPSIWVQVWRKQHLIHHQDLRLGEVVRRYGQWVPVTKLVKLPSDRRRTDEIRLVLAMDRPGGQVFVDDLTLDDAY